MNLDSYTTPTVIDNCEPMMLLLGKAQTETTTKHNNPNNLRLEWNNNKQTHTHIEKKKEIGLKYHLYNFLYISFAMVSSFISLLLLVVSLMDSKTSCCT